jgi:hypothetical protein
MKLFEEEATLQAHEKFVEEMVNKYVEETKRMEKKNDTAEKRNQRGNMNKSKIEKIKESVKFPEYGEWCMNCIIDSIRKHGIENSKEELENEIFNPDSKQYRQFYETFGYNPEDILRNINYHRYYRDSLYKRVFDDFDEAYTDYFCDLNNIKNHSSEVREIIVEDVLLEESFSLYLLDDTLEKIKIDELKKIIMELVS